MGEEIRDPGDPAVCGARIPKLGSARAFAVGGITSEPAAPLRRRAGCPRGFGHPSPDGSGVPMPGSARRRDREISHTVQRTCQGWAPFSVTVKGNDRQCQSGQKLMGVFLPHSPSARRFDQLGPVDSAHRCATFKQGPCHVRSCLAAELSQHRARVQDSLILVGPATAV